MFAWLVKLWIDEEGSFVEYLVQVVVVALGVAGVSFGLLGAYRGLAGREVAAIRCLDPTNIDPACVQ